MRRASTARGSSHAPTAPRPCGSARRGRAPTSVPDLAGAGVAARSEQARRRPRRRRTPRRATASRGSTDREIVATRRWPVTASPFENAPLISMRAVRDVGLDDAGDLVDLRRGRPSPRAGRSGGCRRSDRGTGRRRRPCRPARTRGRTARRRSPPRAPGDAACPRSRGHGRCPRPRSGRASTGRAAAGDGGPRSGPRRVGRRSSRRSDICDRGRFPLSTCPPSTARTPDAHSGCGQTRKLVHRRAIFRGGSCAVRSRSAASDVRCACVTTPPVAVTIDGRTRRPGRGIPRGRRRGPSRASRRGHVPRARAAAVSPVMPDLCESVSCVCVEGIFFSQWYARHDDVAPRRHAAARGAHWER